MKTILITGTSSGLGKQIASVLASNGHKVVGTSRKPDPSFDKYPMLALDVTQDSDVARTIKEFIKLHGKIDILINNAGYGIAGPFEDTTIEEANAQLDANFFGIARMIKAVLPYMRERKSGLIINIGSIGGHIGLPFQAFYSASKFAIQGLTEALRIELKPFDIDVVNVDPGDFATGFTSNRRLTSKVSGFYESKFKAALDAYEKDELEGSDPMEVAKLIESLVKKEGNYKVRYFVGATLQKLAITLKKIVGSKTFETIMRKTYSQ